MKCGGREDYRNSPRIPTLPRLRDPYRRDPKEDRQRGAGHRVLSPRPFLRPISLRPPPSRGVGGVGGASVQPISRFKEIPILENSNSCPGLCQGSLRAKETRTLPEGGAGGGGSS